MRGRRFLGLAAAAGLLCAGALGCRNPVGAEIREYLLTVLPPLDGFGTTFPAEPTTVRHGQEMEIRADPSPGYRFVMWSVLIGQAEIADAVSPVTTVKLTGGDATVVAGFSKHPVLALAVFPEGGGSTEPAGAVAVPAGETRDVSAHPNAGYRFVTWTVIDGSAEIDDPAAPSTSVTPQGSANVQAVFELLEYTLTVDGDGNGSTEPAGAWTVRHGEAAEIAAFPATGFRFDRWDVVAGSASIGNRFEPTTTVVLTDGDAAVTARFRFASDPLLVMEVEPPGAGRTIPEGTMKVQPGVPQAITAEPKEEYRFARWELAEGAAAIADPGAISTTVTLTEGYGVVRAVFEPNEDTQWTPAGRPPGLPGEARGN